MNKILLVTRPQHDETTNYLFYWAEQVIAAAKNKGFKVLDLFGSKANLIDFSGRIQKLKPSLIFLNGHGSPGEIKGHDDQVLISEKQNNESLLKDKITYSLSCSSAKKLGKSAIMNGARSFIGYMEDFVFVHEKEQTTRPTRDKTAELFFGPSNLVVTTLIKGNSSKEAFNRSQEGFNQNLRKLLTSESPQEDRTSIPWLYWDMVNQVCLGDAAAKL